MKPAPSGRTLDGNLTGRTIGLSLAEDAAEHLMGVLTDLYSDRQLAVLREYATNAADAHVEAGVERPIEVSLPTPLKPVLSIRDYGPGLDERDLERIYTKYGASTKRDADIAAGMLGLGCKSALTYGDQFSVITRKNGMKITSSITRNEKGSGELTMVGREPTTGTGVTILVPVDPDDCQKFQQKADNLFRYWPSGSVLVNGEPPAHLTEAEDVQQLTDELYMQDSDEYGGPQLLVVQGGVVYPTSTSLLSYGMAGQRRNSAVLPRGKQLVRFVPIGTVDFVPSREELADTPRTQQLRELVEQEYQQHLVSSFQARLDAAPMTELSVIAEEAQRFGISGLKRDGLPVHRQAYVSGAQLGEGARGTFSVSSANFARTILVKGFVAKTMSPVHRERIRRHAVEKLGVDEEESPRWIAAAHHEKPQDELHKDSTRPASGWAAQPYKPCDDPGLARQFAHVIEWEDVGRLPRANSGSAGDAPYEAAGEGGYWSQKVSAGELDGRAVYVFHPHGESPDRWARYNPDQRQREQVKAVLDLIDEDAVIVKMNRNRRDKFYRLVPQAKDALAELSKAAATWYDGLTEHQRTVLGRSTAPHHVRAPRWWRELPADELLDPEVAEAVRLERAYEESRQAKDDEQELAQLRAKHARWVELGHGQQVEAAAAEVASTDELEARYPLVEWDSRPYGTDHATLVEHAKLYLNAAYIQNRNNSADGAER